jgi:hypothetical protein
MTRHICQGPNCHTYTTQSRIRGPKGSKVLRTRYAYATFNPSTPNCWEDYFCDERCLHAWLRIHLTQVMNFVGIRTKVQETPIEVTKEVKQGWRGEYTDTLITKLLNNNITNDSITT